VIPESEDDSETAKGGSRCCFIGNRSLKRRKKVLQFMREQQYTIWLFDKKAEKFSMQRSQVRFGRAIRWASVSFWFLSRQREKVDIAVVLVWFWWIRRQNAVDF
jgi:hypothetical protein